MGDFGFGDVKNAAGASRSVASLGAARDRLANEEARGKTKSGQRTGLKTRHYTNIGTSGRAEKTDPLPYEGRGFGMTTLTGGKQKKAD